MGGGIVWGREGHESPLRGEGKARKTFVKARDAQSKWKGLGKGHEERKWTRSSLTKKISFS